MIILWLFSSVHLLRFRKLQGFLVFKTLNGLEDMDRPLSVPWGQSSLGRQVSTHTI